MRFKILLGILVLSLVVSLGVNAYLYRLLVNSQAQTNNLLSQTIADWARGMDVARYLLRRATTNAAMAEPDFVLMDMQSTAEALLSVDYQTVYLYMALAAGDVQENLFPYSVGSDLKYISQTAIEMFAVLCAKIQNLTSLFDTWELTHPQGANPIHMLEEKGLIDSIIANCTDVRNYSAEISNFSPKFQ